MCLIVKQCQYKILYTIDQSKAIKGMKFKIDFLKRLISMNYQF